MYEYGVQIGNNPNDKNGMMVTIPARDLDDLYDKLGKSFKGKYANITTVRVPGISELMTPQPKWFHL